MHVSIAMDGVTQQVFAQKMTRIHVYAGHVNMSIKEEPISAERAFKNYMFNGIKFVEMYFFLHFNDFNLYSFCPLISLVV